MSTFIDYVKKQDDISIKDEDEGEGEGENLLRFKYSDFNFKAETYEVDDLIINKISSVFSYENKKKLQKIKVYEIVNRANSRFPLIKLAIEKMNSTEITISFGIDGLDSLDSDFMKKIHLIAVSAMVVYDILNGKKTVDKE